MEIKATRDAFGDALVLLGREMKNLVVIDCDLAGATKTVKFREMFPKRFLQFGIQEANAIGAAAGLSLSGFKPFVCGFACFMCGRYDQVRVSIAYNDAPVVLVGSHAGLAIGKDGGTHMGTEDINVMRGLPNMTIIQPADYPETVEVVRYLAFAAHPAYLRICRQPVPNVNKDDYVFKFGKGVVLAEGNDLAIFVTGGMVYIIFEAVEELKKQSINARVINIHTIKPIDKDIILKAVKEVKGIVTVEDHSIYGGLGTTISEVITDSGLFKPLKRCGINDVFGESGDPKDLYRKHKLDKEGLIDEIIKFEKKL